MNTRAPTIAWQPRTAVLSRDWAALGYLTSYRAILAMAMATAEWWDGAPRAVGSAYPVLFDRAATAYLVVALAAVAGMWLRRPGFDRQVIAQAVTDIVVLVILMHASGGVESGFGMLMVVAIAGASILTHGRNAITLAALASLAVLAQQLFNALDRANPVGDYTHAGLLGLTFFTTAVLAFFAARRVRESEGLAASRAVDVANLAQLNEHIIERMQSGIVVMDADLRVHRFNAAARDLLALDESDRGRELLDVAPHLAARRTQWLNDPRRSTYTLHIEPTDREVSISFAALSADRSGEVLVFAEDAGAMFQRAQALKLASLGRLTASIAHEIRNPLSAISQAGQLLSEGADLHAAERRLTEIIRTNALRMDSIIESVLALSRRAPSEPTTLHAAAWLAEFAEEFRTEMGTARAPAVSVTPQHLELNFDAGQFRQVLWNLCENSVRHGGAEVRLWLRAGISADGVRPYVEAADDGPGLDEDAARHIFEPFFTTRSDGSGLGLYIARELCEANRATLALRASDAGAVFRITFADPRRQQVAA